MLGRLSVLDAVDPGPRRGPLPPRARTRAVGARAAHLPLRSRRAGRPGRVGGGPRPRRAVRGGHERGRLPQPGARRRAPARRRARRRRERPAAAHRPRPPRPRHLPRRAGRRPRTGAVVTRGAISAAAGRCDRRAGCSTRSATSTAIAAACSAATSTPSTTWPGGRRCRRWWPRCGRPSSPPRWPTTTCAACSAGSSTSTVSTATRLVDADPVLRLGLLARHDRRRLGFTRFDGRVDRVPTPSPTDGGALAPTSLEAYAVCPRRYFLGQVLRVPVAERPEDIQRISARDKGSLVHEILERFLARETALERSERIRPGQRWSEAHAAVLDEIADEVFDEYVQRGLTGRALLWELDRSAIRRDLHRFLTEDDRRRSRQACVPDAVELRFGPGDATPVAVHLRDGRSLAFKGVVDRIDRADTGRVVVVDYKTGGDRDFSDLVHDPVMRGTKLQLPIYGLAARARYGEVDVRTSYWFLSEKAGFKERGYDLDDASLDRFGEAVEVIVHGIESGAFPARPGAEDTFRSTFANCSYCDFDPICPNDREQAWQRVKAAPVLSAYVELSEGDVTVDDARPTTRSRRDGAPRPPIGTTTTSRPAIASGVTSTTRCSSRRAPAPARPRRSSSASSSWSRPGGPSCAPSPPSPSPRRPPASCAIAFARSSSGSPTADPRRAEPTGRPRRWPRSTSRCSTHAARLRPAHPGRAPVRSRAAAHLRGLRRDPVGRRVRRALAGLPRRAARRRGDAARPCSGRWSPTCASITSGRSPASSTATGTSSSTIHPPASSRPRSMPARCSTAATSGVVRARVCRDPADKLLEHLSGLEGYTRRLAEAGSDLEVLELLTNAPRLTAPGGRKDNWDGHVDDIKAHAGRGPARPETGIVEAVVQSALANLLVGLAELTRRRRRGASPRRRPRVPRPAGAGPRAAAHPSRGDGPAARHLHPPAHRRVPGHRSHPARAGRAHRLRRTARRRRADSDWHDLAGPAWAPLLRRRSEAGDLPVPAGRRGHVPRGPPHATSTNRSSSRGTTGRCPPSSTG